MQPETRMPDPQSQSERIPDPTLRSTLPKSLLAALGNTHVNLGMQVHTVAQMIETVGWPDGESIDDFDLVGGNLMTALDYARENARLTWVLCGLTDTLQRSMGIFNWGPNGELISMGEPQ